MLGTFVLNHVITRAALSNMSVAYEPVSTCGPAFCCWLYFAYLYHTALGVSVIKLNKLQVPINFHRNDVG